VSSRCVSGEFVLLMMMMQYSQELDELSKEHTDHSSHQIVGKVIVMVLCDVHMVGTTDATTASQSATTTNIFTSAVESIPATHCQDIRPHHQSDVDEEALVFD